MIAAIPTLYKDVQFRSRLEAKWAAFFDLLGWPWGYEPIDLNGYIPDFILYLHEPVLVEVKPFTSDAQFQDPTVLEKLQQSGWEDRILLVGARIDAKRKGFEGHIQRVEFGEFSQYCHSTLGLFGHHFVSPAESFKGKALSRLSHDAIDRWYWDWAPLTRCLTCGKPSFHHPGMTWHCAVCGVDVDEVHGDRYGEHRNPCDEGVSLFRRAGNEVQWNRNRHA